LNFTDGSSLPPRKKILFLSNLSIAYYILGDFVEAVKLADVVVNSLNELEAGQASNKSPAIVDQPVEVLNNLAVFNLMRGGEYLTQSTRLFIAAEKAARLCRHTSHRSLLTLLNNLCVYAYAKKDMAELKTFCRELNSLLQKDPKKKPIYLINLASLYHKQGELQETEEILTLLKTLVDSEEGVNYFDLESIKRIFLLSSLNNIKLKKLSAFEQDMKNYKSLLPSPEEDPLAWPKAERMHAIGLIKFGQVEKAKRMLDAC